MWREMLTLQQGLGWMQCLFQSIIILAMEMLCCLVDTCVGCVQLLCTVSEWEALQPWAGYEV